MGTHRLTTAERRDKWMKRWAAAIFRPTPLQRRLRAPALPLLRRSRELKHHRRPL
jgi:hypothetical protein